MPHDLYLAGALAVLLLLAVALGQVGRARRPGVHDAHGEEATGPKPGEDGTAAGRDTRPAGGPPEDGDTGLPTATEPATQALAEAILSGSRRALSRGVTLVESRRPEDRAAAAEIMQAVFPNAGGAIRIGISGPPGVGKSTFAEAFGLHAIAAGRRVAVLAVDPSSVISGGSILGDKTRMESLGRSGSAYIRPIPSGGLQGGIARGVRESITLCEAAGFDVILIETMGVGQAEFAVRGVVDLVVLLVQPGAGDSLQGIKRGIVEIADFVLVNKADGDLQQAAMLTVGEYKRALRLMAAPTENWTPEVFAVSAIEGTGIDHAWERIEAFHHTTTEDGTRDAMRAAQAVDAVWDYVNAAVRETIEDVRTQSHQSAEHWEAEVRQGRLPPAVAARTLLDVMRNGKDAAGDGR